MAITDGVDSATLSTWLSQAQTAYADLMRGAKVVSLNYGMGDGQRSVTYSQTNAAALSEWIGELQRALNLPRSRRRALRPIF